MKKLRHPVWYGLRIERCDYEKIREIAKARGMDMADLFRELIKRELKRLNALDEVEAKYIG